MTESYGTLTVNSLQFEVAEDATTLVSQDITQAVSPQKHCQDVLEDYYRTQAQMRGWLIEHIDAQVSALPQQLFCETFAPVTTALEGLSSTETAALYYSVGRNQPTSEVAHHVRMNTDEVENMLTNAMQVLAQNPLIVGFDIS